MNIDEARAELLTRIEENVESVAQQMLEAGQYDSIDQARASVRECSRFLMPLETKAFLETGTLPALPD